MSMRLKLLKGSHAAFHPWLEGRLGCSHPTLRSVYLGHGDLEGLGSLIPGARKTAPSGVQSGEWSLLLWENLLSSVGTRMAGCCEDHTGSTCSVQ